METTMVAADGLSEASDALLAYAAGDDMKRLQLVFTDAGGDVWARVEMHHVVSGLVSAFPCYAGGAMGDADNRVAHMGVNLASEGTREKAAGLVLQRSRRMINSERS